MIWHEPKITNKTAIFAPPKYKDFFLSEIDKIIYFNLDSAKTTVSRDDSMLSPVPSEYSLDDVDSNADEEISDELIFFKYTDSNTSKDPILLSPNHLMT